MMTRLGEIANSFDSFILKDVLIKNDSGDWGFEPNSNPIGIIRSTNFTNQGKFNLTDLAYRSIDENKLQQLLLQENEILIERSGGSDNQPVGRVGFIDKEIEEKKLVFANFIQRISVNDLVHPKFVYYCLQQMYERGVTNSMQYQTTGIRNLDFKLYIKSVLPKPSLPEQRKIASILTKVDDAIQAVKSTIEKAERLKKSLMQNLLTGKLKPDGTWRSDDEFYETKLGFIPKNWEIDHLGNLTIKITDGEHISPEFQPFGKFIFSAEDIYDDGINFDNAKYVKEDDCKKFRNRCNPELGDVLIVSRGASIGRTCMVEIDDVFCLMGSVILVKPNEDKLNGEFISQYLKSYLTWKELRKLSGTTAQQAIYIIHLHKMRVAFPKDLEEQKAIAKKIKSVDHLINSKKQKIQKLERLKKALMQNLLTGKVRVKV